VGDNFTEQFRFTWVVSIAHHGRADGGDEAFFYGESIVVPEEGQNLIVCQAVRVFRKRLGGDANGGDFEACFFVRSLGLTQENQCVLNLILVVSSVERHECRNRAYFWLCPRIGSIRL